jgi:anhydro-N-acetylmuramic acid kinase
MNANIRKLHRIASKKSRLLIGLMSGTSLDGLDVALCRFRGAGRDTRVELLAFRTVPYTDAMKQRIRAVFAQQQISFHALCELNPWVANLHAKMVLQCLRQWKVNPSRIDAIASHGQTVFHAPRALTAGATLNSTLQVGDGDHLAVATGIVTLSDFRQKHIAAGGEGAPLAMYGDYLLFSRKGENRILLNMGGIGNFTFLPGSGKANNVLVTDTGPGNTLLDQTIQRWVPGASFDRDAAVAKRGTVNIALLRQLKAHPFFKKPFPKTTGPELFNTLYVEEAQQKSRTTDLALEDLMATLTRFSAETIAEAIMKLRVRGEVGIFASGGGAHNPLLMRWIAELLPNAQVQRFEKLGLSGDAKEAVLFAALANETLAGGRVNFGSRARVPSIAMGKISFPQ